MSHELKEGVELLSIAWNDDEVIQVADNSPTGCVSITVREQCGEMGMVPWAEVVFKDQSKYLYNLRNVEGVKLK